MSTLIGALIVVAAMLAIGQCVAYFAYRGMTPAQRKQRDEEVRDEMRNW